MGYPDCWITQEASRVDHPLMWLSEFHTDAHLHTIRYCTIRVCRLPETIMYACSPVLVKQLFSSNAPYYILGLSSDVAEATSNHPCVGMWVDV